MWHVGVRVKVISPCKVEVGVKKAKFRVWKNGKRTDRIWVNQVHEKLNITKVGVGGLDGGSEAPDTWYYVWLLRSSRTERIRAILSRFYKCPVINKEEWDQREIVGVVRNNGQSDFVKRRRQRKIGIKIWKSQKLEQLEKVKRKQYVKSMEKRRKEDRGRRK